MLWQVHEDTDQNGVLAFELRHHGGVRGDGGHLTYFDSHHPAGLALDAFIDVSPGEHQVAVAIDGELIVLDSLRGGRWSAGPLGPWPDPTPHTLGARRDAGFVDDERVVVLTSENQLEVCDATGARRAIASIRRSSLSRVDVSAGWAFVRVSREDGGSGNARRAMYGDIDERFRQWDAREGDALRTRNSRRSTEGDSVRWWAVHVDRGLAVELGDGVGWPAAWGLVRRSGDGRLSLVLLDGSEVVVASGCSATDLVVPGIASVGVVHECGSNGIKWVGIDGVPHEVTTHAEPPATDDPVWASSDQVVRGLRVLETTMRATDEPLRTELVLVAPDLRRIWPDDADAETLGGVHVQREAPNGFVYADTLRARDGALYLRDASWRRVPEPVDQIGCMSGDDLAPALWGRCVARPAEPLWEGPVDAEGWALVTRGEWGTCDALGPLQPVWANLLDPRAASPPVPTVEDEPKPISTPETWLDVRYAWRSLTLPANTFRFGASGRLGRNPGASGTEASGSLALGVAYGVTDFVEIGIDADRVALSTPTLMDPDESEGALSWNADTRFASGALPLYARLHLAHYDDAPSQVIDAAVELGVRVPHEGSASAWVAFMMRANLPISPFSFDVGLQLELGPDGALGGPRFDLWLPFAILVQVSDSFFIVTRMGLRWMDRHAISIPLGLEVGTTLQHRHRPLVDVTLAFGFPAFLAPGTEGDPLPIETWQFMLGARTFLGP